MNEFAAAFGALLLGWLIADLLGGIVHWVEDRLLSERVPLIGAYIVAPNRLHHREPLAFTRSGFLDRNLATFVVAGTLSALWAWALGISLIWASATLGGLVSSQVHYLTHRPRPGHAWLRVLQDVGLIQSAGHHAGHHRAPSDRRYCVLTDWLNPALDALRVWHRLEALLARIGVPLDCQAPGSARNG